MTHSDPWTPQPFSIQRLVLAASTRSRLVRGASGKAAAFRKARRISRPYLQIMTVSLTILGAMRLFLGDFLGRRVDPMQELLFGDDIMTL